MMATIELTRQQGNAVDFVVSEIQKGTELLSINGPAGSGKTTLIKALVKTLSDITKKQVIVCATTNKAARVLTTKGIDAQTLHQACLRPLFKPPLDKLAQFLELTEQYSDIYKIPVPKSLLDDYNEIQLRNGLEVTARTGVCAGLRALGVRDIFSYLLGWLPAPEQPGILIVDESSMLGAEDLFTVQGVFQQIILVGDEFQLPPVKSRPVFWEVPVKVTLTEIHRQAEGSQPLKLATALRNGERISATNVSAIDVEVSRAGMPVLVWRNKTRESLTRSIREKRGFAGLPPQPGEVLICRNGSDKAAKQKGLVNNSMWTVVAAHGFVCDLVDDQGSVVSGQHIYLEDLQMGDGVDFRFAYALTVHNSQGSEWPKVMIHQPDAAGFFKFKEGGEDARRWLYTGITRARDEVLWVNRA